MRSLKRACSVQTPLSNFISFRLFIESSCCYCIERTAQLPPKCHPNKNASGGLVYLARDLTLKSKSRNCINRTLPSLWIGPTSISFVRYHKNSVFTTVSTLSIFDALATKICRASFILLEKLINLSFFAVGFFCAAARPTGCKSSIFLLNPITQRISLLVNTPVYLPDFCQADSFALVYRAAYNRCRNSLSLVKTNSERALHIRRFSGALLSYQRIHEESMASSAKDVKNGKDSLNQNVENLLQRGAPCLMHCDYTIEDVEQTVDRLSFQSPNGQTCSGPPHDDQSSGVFLNSGAGDSAFEDEFGKPIFKPKKILVLTKLTRLEFERRTHPDLSDEELSKILKERGSDYGRLVAKNRIHSTYLNNIIEELRKQNIEYRLIQRWDYTEENIRWADVIFTAGGDGTFLLAASKINDRNKPVIGINTDPSGSEGYMCLLKKLPESKFSEAFSKLLRGEFSWLWRQRIRVTLSGKHAMEEPIELHDQQLLFPEFRWSEHVREYEDARSRLRGGRFSGAPSRTFSFPSSPQAAPPDASKSRQSDDAAAAAAASRRRANSTVSERVLPYLALNEVFIGESLSSRVSYYELKIDGGDRIKQKSSGFTVCTGTGSTSWYFNINKLTDKCVADLLDIVNDELRTELPSKDPSIVSRLCRRFNDQLIFSPSDLRMAFTVRDPVFNATYKPTVQRGFAKKVVVKSRCFDANLVIDGGMSYVFNDGSQATLEMRPEDALRTVIFR